jgi:hypothetical protein
MQDMILKGRQTRRYGEDNPTSKLTDASILAIRAADPHGEEARRAVAIQYGISYSYLKKILRRDVWTHI